MSGVEPIDPHPSASAVLGKGHQPKYTAMSTKADRKTTQGDALGPFGLAARPRPRRAEFPLYHTASNLSIGNFNKKSNLQNPIIVQHCLLTFLWGHGIMCTVRGRKGRKPTPPMYYGKDAVKPLDKFFKIF